MSQRLGKLITLHRNATGFFTTFNQNQNNGPDISTIEVVRLYKKLVSSLRWDFIPSDESQLHRNS